MSSKPAISVSGVSKSFRMYGRPHQRLVHGLLRGRADHWYRQFEALRDINMEVAPGETVGLIGRNGSGKSTLLQIICGTLSPTHGEVRVEGRIAALLELGAGFNPDFTGRENVYMNGAVLGLSRQEVNQRFAAIAEFADIGEFIEQPVKTYSSGMYVRLAFAVAINTDPRILVVDEALSVGDEAFQRKCFARIEELKREGCTILFVSHSAGSIVQLCDRAMLLDGGELIYTGAPKKAIARYQRLLYAPADRRQALRQEIKAEAESTGVGGPEPVGPGAAMSAGPDSGSGIDAVIEYHDLEGGERYEPGLRSESTVEYVSRGARILDPHLVNENGQRVNILVPGRRYRYRYRVEFEEAAEDVHFGMMLKTVMGVELFGMASHPEGKEIQAVPAGARFEVEFRFMSHLLPGSYFLNAGVVGRTARVCDGFLHRVLDACMFKVERLASDRRKVGFYDLALEPACRIVSNGV